MIEEGDGVVRGDLEKDEAVCWIKWLQ